MNMFSILVVRQDKFLEFIVVLGFGDLITHQSGISGSQINFFLARNSNIRACKVIAGKSHTI